MSVRERGRERERERERGGIKTVKPSQTDSKRDKESVNVKTERQTVKETQKEIKAKTSVRHVDKEYEGYKMIEKIEG